MLPFGGWTAIGAGFLRTRIRTRVRSRPIVLDSLVTVGTSGLGGRIRALFDLPVRLPVARCRTDFEFVQLVPLFIGAIPLGDGRQFANPTTRIDRLWIIHIDIMDYTAALVQYSLKMRRADRRHAIDPARLSAL